MLKKSGPKSKQRAETTGMRIDPFGPHHHGVGQRGEARKMWRYKERLLSCQLIALYMVK